MELSTSTTRARKSFISGLATAWKKNWSKPFRQRRYDMGEGATGRADDHPNSSSSHRTYWRSGNSGPRDSGLSPRGLDIDLFSPFHCSARSESWAP